MWTPLPNNLIKNDILNNLTFLQRDLLDFFIFFMKMVSFYIIPRPHLLPYTGYYVGGGNM